MPPQNRIWAGWLTWAYACLCLPIVMVVFICAQGAYFDSRNIRATVLRNQIDQLRVASVYFAAGLGSLEEAHDGNYEEWEQLREVGWFKRYWSAVARKDDRQLYFAIVDEDGTIVMHSDTRQVGKSLGHGWYDHRLSEVGADVVRVTEGPLSAGAAAYDVSVPLSIIGPHRGEIHAGLNPQWLDTEVARQSRQSMAHWKWLMGLSLFVSVLATGSLVYLARHNQTLAGSLAQLSRARALELSNLGAGLAHEVRNPLHALRINLHILRRAIDGRASLPEDQLLATTRESDTAIDRIEVVLRDLLEFVEPTAGNVAEIDLGSEVRTVLELLAESLKRDQIEVKSSDCEQTAVVLVDATRMRHMLLGLLTFVQLRVGKHGTIELATIVSDSTAQLAISHGGASLTAEQAAHLFEPFRAPVDNGSGLGLALVKAHVSSAGGSVRYEQPQPIGNRLVLSLPVGRFVQKERQHELQT